MKALTAKRPRTRYVTDPIATGMISAARTMSDRALDRFLAKAIG